jgi:AmiR/NasT family two-component response regulator
MTATAPSSVLHLQDRVAPRIWHRPVIRTLVAMADDSSTAVVDALEDLARFQVIGHVSTPADVQREVARLRPDVLLLDAVLDDEPMVPWVPTMLASSPATKVVLCAAEMRTSLRDEAAAVGVRAIVGQDDPFERVLRTIDNLVPDLAGERRRSDDRDDFQDRMQSLLGQEESTSPVNPRWWRQRGVRPLLVAALIASLPVLAMAAWVVASLLGFTR